MLLRLAVKWVQEGYSVYRQNGYLGMRVELPYKYEKAFIVYDMYLENIRLL